MNCLTQFGENSELLLAYSAGKLNAESKAELDRHLETCPGCRELVRHQESVWSALDSWEAAPVSPDFDRRLLRRIEQEVSWWDRLLRPFRPMLVRQALPVAAAALVMVTASSLLRQPASLQPAPQTESAQLEAVQPEQVENAVQAMQMLSDFSHQVKAAASESQM